MHVCLSGTSYVYSIFSKILLKYDAQILNILVVLHECNILKIKMLFHPYFPTLLLSKNIIHPIVESIILPTNFIFRISEKSNFLNSISYVTKRWKTENSASSVFLLCTFFLGFNVTIYKDFLFSNPSTAHLRKNFFVTDFLFILSWKFLFLSIFPQNFPILLLYRTFCFLFNCTIFLAYLIIWPKFSLNLNKSFN